MSHYSDLLDDQDDEDEAELGQLLVQSRQSWCMEIAKWISEARAAKLAEDDYDDNIAPVSNSCLSKWKPVTLATLFDGQKEPPQSLQTEVDAEVELMQALAEADNSQEQVAR